MQTQTAVRDKLGEDIRTYWDGRAATYSNGVVGELSDKRADPWERTIARTTAVQASRARAKGRVPRAIDLGCGPGFFEVLLAGAGWEVAAVDGSAAMIGQARANVASAQHSARVEFTQGDFASLPFADNTFDLAISRNVTWLMREPEATYAEWLRVLRPGGKLLVFDANWYRYLVDPAVDARRVSDQATTVLEDYDETSMASSAEERRCEELAAGLPLTPVLRPAWDVRVLTRLGASDVRVDEDAWKTLWSPSEQEYYGSSPLFSIEATKA